MAWFAVDKDGTEIIWEGKPTRNLKAECWCLQNHQSGYSYIILKKGFIEKHIGYRLTWSHNPVKC